MRAHGLIIGVVLAGFVAVGCEGAFPTRPPASPSPTPAPSMTADEQALAEAIRVDARVDCAPRRTDLPAFAIAGVECTIGSDTVERVGAYSFGPATDERGNAVDGALLAYTTRLAEYGVKLRQGDCDTGRNGDRAWPWNVPDDVDAPQETRSGCYIDEGHHANIRVTCYGSIYMGVLGSVRTDVFSAGKAIRDLYHWTWRTASDEIGDRDPPGICAAPD
jgi:hypothetical protein